jgi:hypothetical protein
MKTQAEAYNELQTLSEEFAVLIKGGISPESDTATKIAKRLNDIQRLYFMPSPFRVGKSYTLMNGQTVIMVGVSNRGTDYECMCDQYGHYRYTTRDFGRSTGTDAMDYDRFIDLSKVDMTGFEFPYWWRLMNKEVERTMSNAEYEAFSNGVMVEDGKEVDIKIFDRDGDTFLVEYADSADDKRPERYEVVMGQKIRKYAEPKFWLSRDNVKFEGGSSAQRRRKVA